MTMIQAAVCLFVFVAIVAVSMRILATGGDATAFVVLLLSAGVFSVLLLSQSETPLVAVAPAAATPTPIAERPPDRLQWVGTAPQYIKPYVLHDTLAHVCYLVLLRTSDGGPVLGPEITCAEVK